MNTPILVRLAAVAIGLCLLVSPATARDHSRHGEYWWESSGYGDPYDEYSFPGIRWYGEPGYRYTPYDDFGESYRGDGYGCGDCGGYYGDYGYDRHRHGRHHGRHNRRHHGGHHRRHHRDDDDD